MIVTVYNFKGGVGKTSISINISLTMGWKVLTNDYYTPLEAVLPKSRYQKYEPMEEIPPYEGHENVIFDFGGQVDFRILPVLAQSDFVIIPVIGELMDLNVTFGALEAIREVNDRIIIVVNRTEGNEWQFAKAQIQEQYSYPIFEIKKSRAIIDMYKEKKSIQTMVSEGGLRKFNYAGVAAQFQRIIRYLVTNRQAK